MKVNELVKLEEMLLDKVASLKNSNTPNDDILLTKSVLAFILELVDERLNKKRNEHDLVASDEDIDNLSCD